ncbi:MAG: DMT family transporter [Pseudorhodoplanes sp.]|nr:MAG: DMT family transporter [Pseudorhodoplanes sp.]
MASSRTNFGFVLGFLGVCIFAGSLPATRLAVEFIHPWFVTAARAALAGVCALAVLAVLRRPLPPKDAWPGIVIIALGVVFGFPFFSALAMENVPASHGAVVLGVLPLATAAAAVVMAHERPGWRFWIAGLAGAALVMFFALRRNGGLNEFAGLSEGDAQLVLAIISAAIAYAASGALTRTMPGWEVISWTLVLSLPFSLLACWLLLPADLPTIPASAWSGLIYSALMAQWMGFFFWNAGLALGGISRVSQVQLVQPFVTVGLAAMVNRETIGLDTILFAIAVVTTVAVATRTRVARA